MLVIGTFTVVALVARRGDRATDLDSFRGLGQRHPALSLALTVFLVAQAGVPFTSGFIAKFGVISAAVEEHSYAIAIIAMVASVIGAFVYLRIIVGDVVAGWRSRSRRPGGGGRRVGGGADPARQRRGDHRRGGVHDGGGHLPGLAGRRRRGGRPSPSRVPPSHRSLRSLRSGELLVVAIGGAADRVRPVSDPPTGSRAATLAPPFAPPVVPMGPLVLAAGDAEKLRALRRMKLVALGLFLAAAAVFVVARLYEDDHAWVGYVRATAEAAMVGALADWFAVTALFRHPLGLPIPHTAIIAKRKDEIGRSLGEFVQGNFLTREVIATRLASVHVSQRLGRWLADRPNAQRAGGGGGRRGSAAWSRCSTTATCKTPSAVRSSVACARPRSPRCSGGPSTWRSTATTTSGCSSRR